MSGRHVLPAIFIVAALATQAAPVIADAPAANDFNVTMTDCWDCSDAVDDAIGVELFGLLFLPLTVIARRTNVRADRPVVLGLCSV